MSAALHEAESPTGWWVLVVSWADSADTLAGPFLRAATAERWASGVLTPAPGCTGFRVELVAEPWQVEGSLLMHSKIVDLPTEVGSGG